MGYSGVVAPEATHRTGAFDCGTPSLSDWLSNHALQAHRIGSCRVYVVCPADSDEVVGHYGPRARFGVSEAVDLIGGRALLIHAEDEEARSWYCHQAEFEPSPTDPLHLLLLIKDLSAAVAN